MNFDTFTMIDGNNLEKVIYPLVEVNQNGKVYIIYLNEVKNVLDKDDFYVGEMINNDQLIPINPNLLHNFEQLVDQLIHQLEGN